MDCKSREKNYCSNKRFQIIWFFYNYGLYRFLRIWIRQFWGRKLPICTDGPKLMIEIQQLSNYSKSNCMQ